jgi:3-deoxy-D-manno-octulosonate 8-phosphate phosphatase (KDO 8-P phosphatase)
MLNIFRNADFSNFVIDVDGVLTDGKIYTSSDGKLFKVFSADDHEAIKLLSQRLRISAVTADFRGLAISTRRVVDEMGLTLELISANERAEWIGDKFDIHRTIYMGDGILDPHVFRKVKYSIAPANASRLTRKSANFVTRARGGEGAVAEACVHIAKKYFSKGKFGHPFL